MNKKITLLGGLLVLQAVLIVATTFRSEGLQGHQGMQALLDFDRGQVDRIVVADGEQRSELRRSGDGWTTADGFPVEADRVDRLLDRLKELEHGLVVAQTEAALQRFKLTEDDFERRVELYAGGKEVASLTLGSGAGARRSHVRAGDAKQIYAVALGSYDLPADIGQWQDKTLLQVEADRVEAVRIGELSVHKEIVEAQTAEEAEASAGEAAEPETTWVAEGLSEGQSFDAESFERDLDRLLTLRYTRATTDPGLPEAVEPVNTIALELADGGTRSYELYHAAADDTHWLKVSDRDEYFEITPHLGGRFGEQFVAEKLIQVDEAPAEDEPGSGKEAPRSGAAEADGSGSATGNRAKETEEANEPS